MNRTAGVLAAATMTASVAGAGGAWAGLQVGSGQIRDESIRSVDVRDATLAGRDLRPGLRRAVLAGIPGYQVVWRRDILSGDRAFGEYTLQCPAGKVALSGGSVGGDLLWSGPLANEEATPVRSHGWRWRIDPAVAADSETDVWLYLTCARLG